MQSRRQSRLNPKLSARELYNDVASSIREESVHGELDPEDYTEDLENWLPPRGADLEDLRMNEAEFDALTLVEPEWEQEESYYEVLQVHSDCSLQQVSEAFHRLVLASRYHKDRDDTNQRLVNRAYITLSDFDTRRKYDQHMASRHSRHISTSLGSIENPSQPPDTNSSEQAPDQFWVQDVIGRLIDVQEHSNPKYFKLSGGEIRKLCTEAMIILGRQPVLLELQPPLNLSLKISDPFAPLTMPLDYWRCSWSVPKHYQTLPEWRPSRNDKIPVPW